MLVINLFCRSIANAKRNLKIHLRLIYLFDFLYYSCSTKALSMLPANLLPGMCIVPRPFSSFSAFGVDAGNSRLYAGIHYQPSIDIGVEQGRKSGAEYYK